MADKAKSTKPFQCMECGKRFSLKGAEKAMSVGCPKCNGGDIDLATETR
jgi:predicted  nucleic acid-binding Zn-ribbon protein